MHIFYKTTLMSPTGLFRPYELCFKYKEPTLNFIEVITGKKPDASCNLSLLDGEWDMLENFMLNLHGEAIFAYNYVPVSDWPRTITMVK